MKGLSETLWLIVALVVIIVVALVVLSIFGNTSTNIRSITDLAGQCATTAKISCVATGILPPDWETPKYVGNEQTTCNTVCGSITANVCKGAKVDTVFSC